MLEGIKAIKTQTACPEVTSDYDDCGSNVEDRYKKPQEYSVKKDKENLFIGHVYPESLAITPKEYITSFACKRDSFHFFPEAQRKGSNLDGSLVPIRVGTIRAESERRLILVGRTIS